MHDILLNPSTKSQLEAYLANPTHGLLIQGAPGSGKTSLLNAVAATLLTVDLVKLASYPYLIRIEPDEKGHIALAEIRRVDHFLSRAVPAAKAGISRAVIIDGADSLTIEAQNALLKNLEEPPENSVFLLSSDNLNNLLPTVRSRLTLIRLVNPTKKEVTDYLISRGVNVAEAKRALSISGGSVALALAVAEKNAEHPLVQAAETARTILKSDSYERLVLVSKLQKEPELAKNTLMVLEQMARIALETASGVQANRWRKVLMSAYKTKDCLEQNANLRLSLTDLMLSL